MYLSYTVANVLTMLISVALPLCYSHSSWLAELDEDEDKFDVDISNLDVGVDLRVVEGKYSILETDFCIFLALNHECGQSRSPY